MKRKNLRKIISVGIVTIMMGGSLTACTDVSAITDNSSVSSSVTDSNEDTSESGSEEINEKAVEKAEENVSEKADEKNTEKNDDSSSESSSVSAGEEIVLENDKDINITSGGKYQVSGASKNSTIYVDTEDEVEIVLSGVSMENQTAPCIYVKNADKVTISTENESTLSVTGSFEADGDTNLDAVIFSKDDLIMDGSGILNVNSSDNAITSKDDLEIKNGTYNIQCTGNAMEAHDEIEISEGTINITGCNDGLHAEDSDDDSIGSVLITGGTFNINATDDAIHGTTTVQIDGGDMTLVGGECIEGTYITINDGSIDISASDDGINAAAKSSKYSTPTFEMNGGDVTINMGAGDTDGVDSNGDIYINGGNLSITGQSTFDYDGNAVYNGGTIIENGTTTNTITNQMMGGPNGGFGKGFGGGMGPENNNHRGF